jgi:hypothetical protein
MTTFVDSRRGSRAPWHLWVVGVLTLLWNGFGVYDFTMSLTQGEPYLRSMGMSDAQITYFNGMPSWTWVAWIADAVRDHGRLPAAAGLRLVAVAAGRAPLSPRA